MTKTSRWFLANPTLNAKVARFLKSKYPSEDFDPLLSEVNYWFSIWGSRGTCDDYIAKDRPPTAAILTVWVGQKVGHRLYREGKDALSRERKGVRTQFEVRTRTERGEAFMHPQAVQKDPSQVRIVRSASKDDSSTPNPNIGQDYEAVDPQDTAEDAIAQEDRIKFVQDVVRVKRSRAAERYARFCRHLLKGLSKEEAALLEGVSTLRVTHMYQSVRNDLKDAPLLLNVALKLLEALVDEPWSTTGELEDVTEGRKETSNALHFLEIRGLVRQGSDQTFAATNLGLQAVQSQSLT